MIIWVNLVLMYDRATLVAVVVVVGKSVLGLLLYGILCIFWKKENLLLIVSKCMAAVNRIDKLNLVMMITRWCIGLFKK